MSIYAFLGKVELPATMLSPQILNCGECCLWVVRDIERGRGVALISYRDGGMVTWSWQWSLGHLQWVSSLLTSHSWDVVSNSDRLRYLSFPCSGCKHAPHTTCLCWSKIPGVCGMLDSDKGFSYPSAERYSRIRLYETDVTHLLYFS